LTWLWRLIALGALLLAGATAACTLLWSRWGHATIAGWVSRGISSGIMGTLEVSRIDRLEWGQVEAHGVTIRAPDGKPAIEAEHAVIEFDPLQMWSRRLGWSRAAIDHCRVHVTEGANGKTNMEEVFKKRHESDDGDASGGDDASDLDLQSMVTSACELTISGGSLPMLRMQDLAGIMRVHVLKSGETELRFDNYRGSFVDGLPTGVLDFQDVTGEVKTGQKRLLHFAGEGRTKGSDVAFTLDISTEPKQVRIDAKFPEASFAAMSTRAVSMWSKLSPTLDLRVSSGD
jgi:hypothetical protein